MKCNASPYEGDKPYIFFSYCHENAGQVYPIIEQMARDGYRIWYDDGLHPGDEWPERIAEMLTKEECGLCMAALSQKFSESHNCKNELTVAVNHKKWMIPIKLEDFPMSLGMQFQLANTQYIEKYRFTSESSFFEKLYSIKPEEMKKFKDEHVPPPPPPPLSPLIIQYSSGRIFEGSFPVTSIGRDKTKCSICFPEGHIGGHHIDIKVENKKYYVIDQNSKNHTWVNGKQLEKGAGCEIGICSEVRIANETLVVAFGEAAQFLKKYKLLVRLQSEATKEYRYLLSGVYVLGRSNSWSGGVLSERHISRKHAVFKITKKNCMLSDVSRYNQTWVNERRIPAETEYLLADKDRIRVGGQSGEYFTVHMKILKEDEVQ